MSLRLLLCFACGICVRIMKPTSRNSLFGPENDVHLEVPPPNISAKGARHPVFLIGYLMIQSSYISTLSSRIRKTAPTFRSKKHHISGTKKNIQECPPEQGTKFQNLKKKKKRLSSIIFPV